MKYLPILLLAACGSGKGTPDAGPASSVNELLGRGVPTFVVGTAGDDLSDRGIAAQVNMIRDLAFPLAEIVDDTGDWPKNPVVYGGPHVNALVAKTKLPFEIGPGRLAIGGEIFTGDDLQIIATIPNDGTHPEFLLYAGTGTPGVMEINSHSGGTAQITIKDVFGIVRTGSWKDGAAVLDPPARRIEWRSVERAHVTVRFPAMLAPSPDEAQQITRILQGVGAAQAAVGAADPVMTIYVYPDPRSKKTLTGDIGDGHAVAEARALHVVVAPGDLMQSLVAHEATHVLAYQTWGAGGSPLIGEGLAVATARQYGGKSLVDWATTIEPIPIAKLLTDFRKLPEPATYPLAGLLVEAAIELVGVDKFRQFLYPAAISQWDAACRAAGTTPEALETALQDKLKR
jgi:hypothetical protein